MARTYRGNKIDKLANMIWIQFPTEVLEIMTGIGQMSLYKKKNHL